MAKKKCPTCGAKNLKERMTCAECGALLASEQLKTQLPDVSTEPEAQVETVIEKAPEERAADEYRDNEKVLHKTSGKLKLPHKKPEEVDCLVTENHVVIVAEEPIKIPLSHIKHCDTAMGSISVSYSTLPQEPLSGTATLTFLDDLNKKRKLSLEMYWEDANLFKKEIDRQMDYLEKAIDRQMVGRFFEEAEEPPGKSAFAEFFRDKTRENICAGLRRLGIDAQMVARGRVEEKICGKGSLGIIHVPDGPIRWINVRAERHGSGQSSITFDYTEYGVPDPRLAPNAPAPYINSVRKKSFPVFGKVVDVLWGGEDYGTGIIDRLSSDHQLKETIMNSRNVTIAAREDYGCWIILTETLEVPSEELWNCYQTIAQYLLAEWPK